MFHFMICLSQNTEQPENVRLWSTKWFGHLFDVEIFFDNSLHLFTISFSSAISKSVSAAPWEPEAISLNYQSECKFHKVTPNSEGFYSCSYWDAFPSERLQVYYLFAY